jgi:2-hydroxy-3-oxopropionate reductase
MAGHLLKGGYRLVVHNRSRGPVDELVAAGATAAASPAEVARAATVVITMLPDTPDVERVLTGPDGVLSAIQKNAIVIDMSSISPVATERLAKAVAEKGAAMLDAPVSGGEPKAVDGTLSIMVGGDRAVFDKVGEVLGAMGATVTHVGDIGAGNIAKLANQVVVALNIAAVAEAFLLAEKAGVPAASVLAAIRGGLAGSTVLEAKAPMMLAHDFTPGFRIDLHVKDLLNALDTSHDVGAPLPLTAAVLEILVGLRAAGHGQDDHSGLLRHYETLAAKRIGDSPS